MPWSARNRSSASAPGRPPAVGKRPVLEIERRPRSFQQRLGNEEAEPETAGFVAAGIAVGALTRAGGW